MDAKNHTDMPRTSVAIVMAEMLGESKVMANQKLGFSRGAKEIG